jgi:hypothetical protein
MAAPDDDWAWDWAEEPTRARVRRPQPISPDPTLPDARLEDGSVLDHPSEPPHRALGNRIAVAAAIGLGLTVALLLLFGPMPVLPPSPADSGRPASAGRSAPSRSSPLVVSTSPSTVTTTSAPVVADDGERGPVAGASPPPGRVISVNPAPATSGGTSSLPPSDPPAPPPSSAPAPDEPGPGVIDGIGDLVP